MRTFLFILFLALLSIHCSNRANKSGAGSQRRWIVLDSITRNHLNTELCGKIQYHPVTVKAKMIADSLKAEGRDTILIYRNWLATNGFNGYGKVLWYDAGQLKQIRITFVNGYEGYGIKSAVYSLINKDTTFSFFSDNQIDTVQTIPYEDDKRWSSHPADHFVYVSIHGKAYCYNVNAFQMRDDPGHLKCRFVRKLWGP